MDAQGSQYTSRSPRQGCVDGRTLRETIPSRGIRLRIAIRIGRRYLRTITVDEIACGQDRQNKDQTRVVD